MVAECDTMRVLLARREQRIALASAPINTVAPNSALVTFHRVYERKVRSRERSGRLRRRYMEDRTLTAMSVQCADP